MSHKKFGPDRFSRFDVYWIQTNKQTPKQSNTQASQIYIQIGVQRLQDLTQKSIRILPISSEKLKPNLHAI